MSFPISSFHKKIAVLVGLLLTSALMFGTFVLPASADSLDDRLAAAENKRSNSEAQIDNLKHELAETDEQLASAYIALQQAQEQLPVAEAALAVAQKEFDTAQREAQLLAAKLQDAQDERTALQAQIEDNDTAMVAARSGVVEMGRQAARGDMEMSSIGLVVGAEDSDDFIERYNMNNTAMRTQGTSLNRLRQTQAVSRNAEVRLEAVNDAIATLKKDADAKLEEADEKKQVAADAKAEVESLIVAQQQAAAIVEQRRSIEEQALRDEETNASSLSNEIRTILGLQEAERAEAERQDKIRREQERKEAEEAAKNKPSTGGGKPAKPAPPVTPPSKPNPPATGGGGGSSSAWFTAWPTNYRVVTSNYGWRMHPVLGYARLHAGTDMRTYCNTPIYAARSGTVQWAKYRGGFGNQVMINHGSIGGKNVMSSYNHLTSFASRSGQSVKAGQLIGYSGTTGTSTACHLHFEVYVNGSTIDPMTKF